MLQVTPHMRILVAVEPADFRCGIDGLAKICRKALSSDPMSGTVFVFRNRRKTAVKLLVYDGRGFWLCYRRLSAGRFRWWPKSTDEAKSVSPIEAHELQVLLSGGDPSGTKAVPVWRKI